MDVERLLTSNKKENSINKKIIEKINEHKQKKLDEYKKEPCILAKTLSIGGNGEIYLYEDVYGRKKFVRKKGNNSDSKYNDLTSEARITNKVGKHGAFLRSKRRVEKGYDVDIRLAAPQVFNEGRSFDMEFMKNGDLSKPHPEIDIYDMLKQTAKLVNNLHEAGYIHRDIKPDNLLVNNDHKIVLADLDSIIMCKDFDNTDNYFTKTYTDYEEYVKTSKHKGNDIYIEKNKLDIYSLAVSGLAYLYGENRFYRELDYNSKKNQDPTSEKGRIKQSREYKKKYISMCERLHDKQLGTTLLKMLNGKFQTMKDVLNGLEKNDTQKDKKSLKIALSYIVDKNSQKEILDVYKERYKLNSSMPKNSLFKIFTKIKLIRINSKLTKLLTKNNSNLNEEKRAHLTSLAKRIKRNKFTKYYFAITQKSIENQKNKNIAL